MVNDVVISSLQSWFVGFSNFKLVNFTNTGGIIRARNAMIGP
jgi:hypothetical protein